MHFYYMYCKKELFGKVRRFVLFCLYLKWLAMKYLSRCSIGYIVSSYILLCGAMA